ncbi:hypothetical protein LWI28_011562 [Acer negundo]|uniref:Protein TIC 40, chloroplastic n=1 Tax=Acer negundo TaxID=4023 RepID=A0AAD5IEF0_ACENE|nr:hypothetical protein LWI28_011562 [Acer negundo]
MENLNMALLSSSSSCPKPAFTYSSLTNPTGLRRQPSLFHLPLALRTPRISRVSVRASLRRVSEAGNLGGNVFANLSSGSGQQTYTSVGNPNLSVPPPPSSTVGSPLFWITVGVGLSAIFSFVTSRLKQTAAQFAAKTMMDQLNAQNLQFGNAASSPGSPFPPGFPFPPGSPFPSGSPFSPGSPFTYPPPPASGPTAPLSSSSTPAAASQPTVSVDVPATKVEAVSATDVKDKTKETKEEKKYAFVDVSPEETLPKSPFENFEDVEETSSSEDTQSLQESLKVNQNGAAFKQTIVNSQEVQSTQEPHPTLSMEALEKMMEDPTVQKMVFPYLPEEMRDPSTLKWMLQDPQSRQKLEDMLNDMRGNAEWDSRMMETLRNFDLNSPEVKQQFDQIGLTPEQVISTIMANPDLAMAFQNPRIQAAIMDCSQNPMSIMKYQNDPEVMSIFNKISELFPGVTG